jgi:hypothetical protein
VTGKTSRPRWIVVALSVAAVLASLGVVAVVGGVLYFRTHVTSEEMSASSAARELDAARARYAGQRPLIEFLGTGAVVHRDSSAPARPWKSLHVLVYDPRDEELTRGEFPASAVRIASMSGRVKLMGLGLIGTGSDILTFEDLERRGPGLILDSSGSEMGTLVVSDAMIGTATSGVRMLIWTE